MSRNAVDALLEEWDRARLEIVALLPRIPAAEFSGGDPLDEQHTRGILVHVLRAGYGYAAWVCDALRFPPPERRMDPKALDGRDAFTAGFADLQRFFFAALGPLQDTHLEPPQGQLAPQFRSRWGENFTVEQMLEHAVCHNLRHRRQLARRLA